MAKRLIDANALGIGKVTREAFTVPEYADGWNNAIEIIENAPAVDAVEVVRCEECRHCESYYPTKAKGEEYYPPQHRCMMLNRVVRPEHFCSYGERKASKDA